MIVSVDVQEIGDFAALTAKHAEDWRRIAGESPAATVFQTWEWTEAWWRHCASSHRLRALVFRENGEVVGFAPLTGSRLPSPLRTLRLAGTGPSDYLDMLALPGWESVVASAFVAYLREHSRRWDWLDLQQIRPGAAADTLCDAAARDRVEVWQGETCPYLPLIPGDWEGVRKSLGKKLRQNIGYYGRALEKQYMVEYRMANHETLADDLDAFFFLHQKRWNKRWLPGAFASRQTRKFHEAAARNLLDAGMLRLHTLSLDGTIQAALYCFHKDDRTCYYLSGFEPEMSRLSIGTVLTAHAIRHAAEKDGAHEFDFLRGNEAYKYRWGAIDRHNRRLSLTRSGGVRPTLLSTGGRVSLQAEHRLKHWMHSRNGGAGGGHGGSETAPSPQAPVRGRRKAEVDG